MDNHKDDDDDDVLQLPGDTLQALQDFRAEKDAREKQFQELRSQAENSFTRGQGKLSMNVFDEDWNASQFWYTDETASVLAKRLLGNAGDRTSIAVVSAPSVYIQLRNMLDEQAEATRPRLCLLEYDKRFEVFGKDFVFYDFEHPLRLPASLKGSFDAIICDPPFLSEDCQTKTALTARFLARDWAPTSNEGGVLLISCTGERMSRVIERLYGKIGVRTTSFEPKHSKGLSNEFRCYANFECDDWAWN